MRFRVCIEEVVVLTILFSVKGQCPNQCHHHGHCDKYGACSCFTGYIGADCSLRTCPSNYAWSDYATNDDTAHAKAECSNRGLCDRSSGLCQCMAGYTGKACESMTCDFNCYNRGKCLSLKHFASTTYSEYSEQFSYTTPWDATKIHGCVCDPPYTTFNCGQRYCPSGDDPLTTNQVNEQQLLKCMATGGNFVLYFRGEPSATIKSTYKEAQVKAALEAASTIDEVQVTFTISNGTVCQSEVTNIVTIEFTHNFGSLPPLKPVADDLSGTITVYADAITEVADAAGSTHLSLKGSKEDDQCSNRGLCDPYSATCSCMATNNDAYSSSNGYGAEGTRGDCGKADSSISTCPGEIACSSNGVCDTDTYRCSCKDGWYGADCSRRSCPKGLSWFSYPSANDIGHDELVECSHGGTCDTATGLCECGNQFFGAACEYLACPTGSTTSACSGNGRCMSMFELSQNAESNGDATSITYGTDANNALTWDAKRVYGCHCDHGWTGYDCSLRICPYGDDPNTYDQLNELQLLTCEADGGSFTLTFRQATTSAIKYNATASELEAALEALSTIADLEITYSAGASLCTASTDSTINVVSLQFVTEHSDLPSVSADLSSLTDSATGTNGVIGLYIDGEATSNGYSSHTGTTEEVECSNRGLCDRSTGSCQCFSGYSSSDGQGNEGTQGDCGHRKLCNAGWCGEEFALQNS